MQYLEESLKKKSWIPIRMQK